MGGLFSTLIFIFFAISIIARIINAAKKQQAKQNTQNQGKAGPVQQMHSRLQDTLRQQAAGYQQNKRTTTQAQTAVPKPETKPMMDTRYREGGRLNRPSLEGAKVEGHRVEGHVVEGHKVEGRNDYYKHPSAASPHRIEQVAIESSMGDEHAGEGCKTHYRIRRKSIKTRKAAGRKLAMNKDMVINGIIMSEILTRREGRRNVGVR